MEKNQSNRIQGFIERDDTNIIKGVAIILMFIHHFFTIPTLRVSHIYIYMEQFSECFKICVPIFAFLTGYFYWLTNKKSFRYSIRKITDFWFCYLFAFLLISIIGFLLGVNSFSIVPFVKEIFALSRPTMIFCWYVVFYIGTMLLLPLFYRVSLINDFLAVSIFSSVPVLAIFVLKIVRLPGLLMISDFLEYFSFLPVVIIGYIIAKYDVLNVLYKRIESFGSKALKKCIYVLFLIIPFFARGGSIALDFLYAPMFVFGLCSLIKHFRHKKVLFPISILGKYSLLMWFLHCAFFNQLKYITQPILYYPRNPVLVTIWGILICLVVAIIIKIPIDAINKLKNKLFHLL